MISFAEVASASGSGPLFLSGEIDYNFKNRVWCNGSIPSSGDGGPSSNLGILTNSRGLTFLWGYAIIK